MNNNEQDKFDIEDIIGFDALYESMQKCKKGVVWKSSVASYYLNGIESTARLERELKEGTYKPRPPKAFEITRPKRRTAVSIAFRDRVYQRSLNDNAIYPAMVRGFIYDNHACQKGRGTDSARNRLGCFLQRAWRRWGNTYYVLQIDVKSYYPSMRHDVAKDALKQRLHPEAYRRAAEVLDGQYAGDIGYNPGSQMVQICGISVLNGLDHYIKERLHVREYIRYMDDMILLSDDPGQLQAWLLDIEERLGRMGFSIHPQKTRVYPISEGIPFLGFRHHISSTGKLYRLIDPQNVKMERKRLFRMVALAKKGEMSRQKVQACYQAWKAHAQKGSTFRMLQRMDAYYKSLWRCNDGGTVQKNQDQRGRTATV